MKAALLAAILFAAISMAYGCNMTITHIEVVSDFKVSVLQDQVSWKAFNRTWKVDLTLTDLFDGNIEHFHGKLEGDLNATVSFSLMLAANGSLTVHAMISLSNDTYWLASSLNASVNIYMYRQSDVKYSGPDCLPNLQPPLLHAEPTTRGGNKRSINSYKVAIFVDQNFADPNQNSWADTASTLSLFNDVNAVYTAAGLGTFQVQAFGTLNSGSTSLTSLLSTFSSQQSNFDSSFTNSIWLIGSNIGGLAYVGGSCVNAAPGSKTAVAGLVQWSRLWTVKTIAHELGHNRGAVHDFTNMCSSSLQTNCQCSVMSYCFPSVATPGGAVNYFSQSSISTMQAAGCL